MRMSLFLRGIWFVLPYIYIVYSCGDLMVTLSHELCMPFLKDFDGATKKPTLLNMHRTNTPCVIYLTNITKDPIPKVESFILCERSPYYTFMGCRFLASSPPTVLIPGLSRLHDIQNMNVSFQLLCYYCCLLHRSEKKLYYNGKHFIDNTHS